MVINNPLFPFAISNAYIKVKISANLHIIKYSLANLHDIYIIYYKCTLLNSQLNSLTPCHLFLKGSHLQSKLVQNCTFVCNLGKLLSRNTTNFRAMYILILNVKMLTHTLVDQLHWDQQQTCFQPGKKYMKKCIAVICHMPVSHHEYSISC